MSDAESTSVKKYSYTIPISLEMLANVDPEAARAAGWVEPPPLPWLTRTRWRFADWWYAHRPHFHLGPCDVGDEDW